jgi:hypothetical protein
LNEEINVKKIIYPLLTLSILFTIGCEDAVEPIIGTWSLSAVCAFADENCTGECTDVTAEFLEEDGSISITFSEGGTGTITFADGKSWQSSDSFNWSGSGPYTLTDEGKESITVTLSDGSFTINDIRSVCIQITFIK